MTVGNEEVYQGEVEKLIAGVPFDSLLRTAVRCAERVAPAWNAFAPKDSTVTAALKDVARFMEGTMSKNELSMWDETFDDYVEQASEAFEMSVRQIDYRSFDDVPPHGIAAHNAEWCASAMSSLIRLATVDEQTDDIEDIQGEREVLFAEVVAYAWVATLYDADERRWQLDEIKRLTRRENPDRIEKRLNELDTYSRRGDVFFFGGLYLMVVTEYDQMIALHPELEESHWRRGIALFYDSRYEEGVQQFEAYYSFDDVDCQSGIWRYFCQRKQLGLEQARAGLLNYTKSDREPFPDVYRLFTGELTPDEILKRSEEVTIGDDEREMRRFYANLYVGLNEFIEDRTESARPHLRKAIASAWPRQAGYGPNFMWHVARLSSHSKRFPTDKELVNDADRFGDNRAWRIR